MLKAALVVCAMGLATAAMTSPSEKSQDTTASKSGARQPAAEDKTVWASTGDTCVVYDYRSLIRAGKKSQNYFAIEYKNHNGGSINRRYPVRKFKSAKQAFTQMMGDIQDDARANHCDGLEVFHPTSENDSSPM